MTQTVVFDTADYIVTGDRRHLLPIGQFEGIQILSPADFLSLFSTQESTEKTNRRGAKDAKN